MRPGEWLIAALDLAPHPEGGWYRRTWVADATPGERPCGSAIYYLLLGDEVSAPHRIDATELWHFYAGDPLELTLEWPDGRRDGARRRARCGVRTGTADGGGGGRLAVGPPAGRLLARRGDRDPRVHVRGVRAPRAAVSRGRWLGLLLGREVSPDAHEETT